MDFFEEKTKFAKLGELFWTRFSHLGDEEK